MEKLIQYADQIAVYLMYIMIIASVVVRITPSTSDNDKVKKIADIILKIISYLPTLGVNPRTKHLEKVYGDIAGK